MQSYDKRPVSEKSPPKAAGAAGSLLDAIGNTPLVYLRTLKRNPKVRICAKLEGDNPGGSIKDRPAWYMIMRAEESGKLTDDKTILEATSGNTGNALAMIGAASNYRVKLAMPGCVGTERRRILEAFGAETLLTPPEKGTDGAILLVKRIFQENPDQYYLPDQYSNENNTLSHYETTGPEIYEQTNGDIDVIVVGMGTTGTLMGVEKYLKGKKPGIRVVGVEPTIGYKI